MNNTSHELNGTATGAPDGCPSLLGLDNLKPRIDVKEHTVACPVRGCSHSVKRQRGRFRYAAEFACPVHHIAISPTTFEYPSEACNILDRSHDEIELLNAVKGAKRECRMARDRSEDAVTWNVFRALQNSGSLGRWLSTVTWRPEAVEDVIFWSYSTAAGKPWEPLNRARRAFNEQIHRGSEPDLIVLSDTTLFFVEAKLDATNNTSGTGETLRKRLAFEHYTHADAGDWFARAFSSDYATILKGQRYELMRFWLLGTWLAKQLKRDFRLVLLLREEAEPGIHADFSSHIRCLPGAMFIRKNWEEIMGLLDREETDTASLLHYMSQKTLGYDAQGNIRRAFTPDRNRSHETPRIEWISTNDVPRYPGHGIEVVRSGGDRQDQLLAFVDGFQWLHGTSNRAVAVIRTPGPSTPPSLLDAVRLATEAFVAQRDASHLPECDGFRLILNG